MKVMDKYKEIISLKKKFDSISVEFLLFDDFTFAKQFENEDEIINFMEKEYYILKCECLEESRKELNKKIDNQRKELFNLNMAYNKLKMV